MKKSIFLIISLLVFTHHTSFAQVESYGKSKIKCTYRHTTKPFIDDTLKVSENFVLIVNDQASMYLGVESFAIEQKRDELFSNKNLSLQDIGGVLYKMPEPVINNYKVYKLKESKTIITHNLGFEVRFRLNESLEDLDWVITNETKELLGYQCLKATLVYGVYNFEAWFTPEIPLSEGPFVFGGLPGLIISIQDTEQRHSFELLEMVEDKDVDIQMKVPEHLYPLMKPKELDKLQNRKRKLIEMGRDLKGDYLFQKDSELPYLDDQSAENIKSLKVEYSLYDNLLFKFHIPQKEI